MALKQYRPEHSRIVHNTDVKLDYPHKISEEQLVPRIVHHTRNAVAVDRHRFYFYTRLQHGRRCSCFSTETSPDGICQVCHGTTVVGGYEKFGCRSHTLDVTEPFVKAVNVRPMFENMTRPVLYGLVDGATSGYIEFHNVAIWPNVSILDALNVAYPVTYCPEPQIQAFVQTELEDSWFSLTSPSLQCRLYAKKLNFRVEFRRRNAEFVLPTFSHIFFRYRLIDDVSVIADIPRRQESITLQEFGIVDSFESIQLALHDNPKKVTTEDFFHRLDDGTMWKAITASPNSPLEVLTAHDIQCRIIQSFEKNYTLVPV
jgi:hypothetical protein